MQIFRGKASKAFTWKAFRLLPEISNKGPGVGACLQCLRNCEEASVISILISEVQEMG